MAGIPYSPFPTIPLGPLELQTFGLCVAVGVLLGGWLTARRNKRVGIGVEQTERIVLLLVVAGLVGARLLFVLTSLDEMFALEGIDRWLYPIAVWNGGLQFSGGFIAALLLAPFITRGLPVAARWHLLDGAALGLSVGLAVGRIGCYAVGEHLGGPTSFFLGITYQGGVTVEGPLEVGQTYWSTPVLEFVYVAIILAIMLWVDRSGRAGAGTLAGLFSVLYAVARFGSDFLRDYDRVVYGLTGAQYMCLALLVVGAWFLWSARTRESPNAYRARLADEAAAADAAAPDAEALDTADAMSADASADAVDGTEDTAPVRAAVDADVEAGTGLDHTADTGEDGGGTADAQPVVTSRKSN